MLERAGEGPRESQYGPYTLLVTIGIIFLATLVG